MSKDGGSSNASNNEKKMPGEDEKKDSFEDRGQKKIIRVITVMAYMFSVSSAGMILSGYYIFLWQPPNPREMHAHARATHSEPRAMHFIGEADIIGNQQNNRKFNNTEIIPNVIYEILKTNNTINHVSVIDESRKLNNATTNSFINSTTTESSVRTSELIKLSTKKLLKNPTGRKQHQTPFALKHLEVPIRSTIQQQQTSKIISSLMKELTTDKELKEVSSENTTPVIPVSLLPETPDSSLSKTGLKERNLWSILTEPVEAKSTPPTIKDKSSSTVPSDPYPMVKQTFDDYQVPGNIETD